MNLRHLFPKRATVGANAGTGIVTNAAPQGFKPLTLSVQPGAAAVNAGGPSATPGAGEPVPATPPAEAAGSQQQQQDSSLKLQLAKTKQELQQAKQQQTQQQSVGQIMTQNAASRVQQRVSGILNRTKDLSKSLASLRMGPSLGGKTASTNQLQTGSNQPEIPTGKKQQEQAVATGPVIGGKPMGGPAQPPAGLQTPQQQQPSQDQTPAPAAQAPAAPAQPAYEPLSADPASRSYQLQQFAKQYQNGDWHAAADAAGKIWGPAAAQDVGNMVYDQTNTAQMQQQTADQQNSGLLGWGARWGFKNPFEGWRRAARDGWEIATGSQDQANIDARAIRPAFYGSTPTARTAEQAAASSEAGHLAMQARQDEADAFMRYNAFDRDMGAMGSNVVGNYFSNTPAMPGDQWMQQQIEASGPLSWSPKSWRQIPAHLWFMPRQMAQRGLQHWGRAAGDQTISNWSDAWNAARDYGRGGLSMAPYTAAMLPDMIDSAFGTQIMGDPNADMTYADRAYYGDPREAAFDNGQFVQAPQGFDQDYWNTMLNSGVDPQYLSMIAPLLFGPDGNGGMGNWIQPQATA